MHDNHCALWNLEGKSGKDVKTDFSTDGDTTTDKKCLLRQATCPTPAPSQTPTTSSPTPSYLPCGYLDVSNLKIALNHTVQNRTSEASVYFNRLEGGITGRCFICVEPFLDIMWNRTNTESYVADQIFSQCARPCGKMDKLAAGFVLSYDTLDSFDDVNNTLTRIERSEGVMGRCA